MPIDFTYLPGGTLGGEKGYSRMASVFSDFANRVVLTHGLHVIVGGAGGGKTIGARGLLYTIDKMLPATQGLACSMITTRESHASPLPLAWFLRNFIDPSVVGGTMYEEVAKVLSSRPGSNAGPSPDSLRNIILIDSITEWMWEIETLAVEYKSGSTLALTAADLAAMKWDPQKDQEKPYLTRRSAPAKSGGVVGEAIQFLRMLDNSAQLQNRTLIVVLNSVTYPLAATRDNTLGGLSRIVKGQVSSLMHPNVAKDRPSYMEISTREQRVPFQFPLSASALNRAAEEIGQGPDPAAQPKTESTPLSALLSDFTSSNQKV